ncbi:uncharacterized protein LOC128734366 [Sabethes cyaneus]|uniref:uncharacterized protein LOC128734366 n=1 Tax=Sabethes cyaneus TaxID=53552 RepID=UPI00237E8520|nr:uncharacterized protein LOC128734366 [Sabethes cyaneus]
MSIKEEILKRLNRPDQDYSAGLQYGMKLWKSNSFYYMSKYEVVFEFFLAGIEQYMQKISRTDLKDFDVSFAVINEFLALPCPSNALPPRIIPKLHDVFCKLTTVGPSNSKTLLDGCMTMAFDIKYKNFYKFDYAGYGRALKTSLEYYRRYLETTFNKEQEEMAILRVTNDIRIYVKSNGDDESWRSAFTSVLPSLCDVILQLKSYGLDRQEELLELLRLIYFQDGKGSNYNRVTDQSKRHLFMNYFEIDQLPMHVIALLTEGYLKAYRETKIDVLLFLKYILLYVFADPDKSILNDIHHIFQLTKYVFYLLRKYFIKIDQKIVEDFDFSGILTHKLKDFLDGYSNSEHCLQDLFSLICTINEYNPLILETNMINIILRTMFIRKEPDTMDNFQAMIISTINAYTKLNRSENFREELFLKLGDYLDDHDLGDQIKLLRKQTKKRKSVLIDGPSGKRRRTETEQHAAMTQEESTSRSAERYFGILCSPKQVDTTENICFHLSNQWKSICFAWPDANGRLSCAMLQYVKGLLTKRSFEYWHKMQNFLAEVIDNLESEEHTETELFKLEFSVCWLCYYFAGNTLVEQTNLFWDKLDRHFKEFNELMIRFGKLLIKDNTDDPRVFGSFLQLVYFYGNYRSIVHYYRPDSIESSDHHLVQQFLSPDEWHKLETRVPSSEQLLLNRVHLQKIRIGQLIANSDSESCEELIQQILQPSRIDHLSWLLQDRSTIIWFLKQVNLDQQKYIVNQLLSNNCLREIEFIIDQMGDNHVMMDALLLCIYQRITSTILADCKQSVAKKLSFDAIYESDEQQIMASIHKLLQKKSEKQSSITEIFEPKQLMDLLRILDQVRIDELPQNRKTVIVGINVLLFADIQHCDCVDVIELHKNTLNKQLTFGMVPNLLKFFEFETLLAIFGKSSSLIVTLLRQTAIFLSDEAFECFKRTLVHFSEQPEEWFELVLLIFNGIQKSNANREKNISANDLNELLLSFVSAIEQYLCEQDIKKLRKENFDAFINCLKGCSSTIRYKVINKMQLTDVLQEKVLCYLKQAIKVDNPSSDLFLTNALQYKDFLRLEPDRIKEIAEKRWCSFLRTLRIKTTNKQNIQSDSDADGHLQGQSIRTFSSFLTHNEPVSDFTVRLNQLEQEASVSTDYDGIEFVFRVYSTFAKNAFTVGVSVDIEKAFVRSFGIVVASKILPLCVQKKICANFSRLEEILKCFSVIVGNPKLTLVPSIMDNIVEFLASTNIQKFAISDNNEKQFYQLHRLISDVLYLLITTRPNYVVNRLPHYFYVFNQLIASVICYKEDWPADSPLNSFEILTLSDLLLPLEKIMSLVSEKIEKDTRILAPYILMQIISFIIKSKRSTTLHEKISRNVHNICYGFIGLYDKHSSGYILRSSDEASRNVYTDIEKGFRKYRSFHGRI